MSQKVNLSAYFERIGFAGSFPPTLATLETIHALHPAAIPFENLDPVMGVPVRLDQASLEKKLIHARRGGYCFEQNTLFRNILRELDYPVRTYPSRVLWNLAPDAPERMVSHTVLIADIGGTSYFCDVGMGAFPLVAPLKLRADVEQPVRDVAFRFTKLEAGWQLDVRLGEDWLPILNFTLDEIDDAEVEAINTRVEAIYHERALLFAARADREARFNLTDDTLTIHRPDAEREQRRVTTVAELKTILSDTFRIALPEGEALEAALARVLAKRDPSEG